MRLASGIVKVQRKIYLTEATSQKIDILLLDPVRGKVRYGTLSDIAEALFIKWIEEQMGAHETSAKGNLDVAPGLARAETEPTV